MHSAIGTPPQLAAALLIILQLLSEPSSLRAFAPAVDVLVRTRPSIAREVSSVTSSGGGVRVPARTVFEGERSPTREDEASRASPPEDNAIRSTNVVLLAGFESFNRELYEQAGRLLPPSLGPVSVKVFADSDIRGNASGEFATAVGEADVFLASLVFDYDDVAAVTALLDSAEGGRTQKTRLIFECATELMEYNKVGSFSMASDGDGPSGPPPAVKAVLSKFSSGREEDKLSGYLELLKVGPELLKFVPGEKAGDLRTWMEAYRYWNQGGLSNVRSMLQLLVSKTRKNVAAAAHVGELTLPELVVTPATGLLHPLLVDESGSMAYASNPKSYMEWRLSSACAKSAKERKFPLAPDDAPRVALLLYR